MADIDDRIKDGLRSLEDDPGKEEDGLIRELIVSTFRGRLRNAALLAWGMILFYSAAAVYCGYRVAESETEQEMILCGGFMVIAVMAVMVTKLWYWMLANRNAVQREVKRLEARIAELTECLGAK